MAACRGFDVVIVGPGGYLDEAGRIWAEATAFRDRYSDVAPLDAARAVIKAVVRSSAQSLLQVALGNDTDALGFAAAVTAGTVHDRRAELRHLGVRPRAGGGGIAARLLAALLDRISSGGLVEAELWVYCDNTCAIDPYRCAQCGLLQTFAFIRHPADASSVRP